MARTVDPYKTALEDDVPTSMDFAITLPLESTVN